MDVSHNTDRLLDLDQIGLLLEHGQCGHQKAHDLRLLDWALASQEILQEAPVWHVVRTEQGMVFYGLIDHAGALLVGEGAVRDGIWD